MNLFLLGWNLSRDIVAPALTEFRGMVEVYPQLDPTTCRSMITEDGRVFVATMHHRNEVVLPRRYVSSEDDHFTFYDGVVFDRTSSFAAHDARQLAEHWNSLPEKLDGQFCVARVRKNPSGIELMTDLLGFLQVYYCRCGQSWLISNSVRPLVRLCQAHEFDPLGVSMFLSQTCVWGDSTFRKDVRTIPPGQLWKFEGDRPEPTKQTYCSLTSLATDHKRCLSWGEVKHLAAEMTRPCRTLNENFGPLRCAITGGRDSRLVMSLFLHHRIQATYFTGGDAKSKDIEVASQIVKKFALRHEILYRTNEDILSRWDGLCKRLIGQGDGMINLWQLPDVLSQPQKVNRLVVTLSGQGGEMARNARYTPLEALKKLSPADTGQILIDMMVYDFGGLVLPDARKLACEHIKKFTHDSFDLGLSCHDVMDILRMYQFTGRWAGTNRRKLASVTDSFTPFGTRSFVEAVFTLPPLYRCCNWLHHQLLRMLVPELAEMPFDKSNWRSPLPMLNLIQWVGMGATRKARRFISRYRTNQNNRPATLDPATLDPAVWLEAKREWIRQICLDQRDSVLWNFVNRDMFDNITSSSTDPSLRQCYRLGIYGILTLFYYADMERNS